MNSPGFPALQGQLCQPASTVSAPALQLAAVPDSSALTGSLLMPGFGSVAVGNHLRSHSSVASAAASAAASEAAMQPVLLALAEVLVGGWGAGADAGAGQVQVSSEGFLVLVQCCLLLARRRSRQHGLMDAEVQSREEEQIVCSGTGEIGEWGVDSEGMQDGEGKDCKEWR